MTVTCADPERLDAYAATTLAAVALVRPGVEAYRHRLARLLDAETDLPVGLADRSGEVTAVLAGLERLDRQAAVLADALRSVDAAWQRYDAVSGHWLHRAADGADTALTAAARVAALRRLREARWQQRELRARFLWARRWARLRWFFLGLWFGWRSPRARRPVVRVNLHYIPELRKAAHGVASAAKAVRDAPGLPYVGKALGHLGTAGTVVTVVRGSPYEGARGTIDRGVAAASLAATATSLTVGQLAAAGAISAAAATGLTVAAGVVLVGAAAWALGNLAKDAWDNRKAIARAVSRAAGTAGDALHGLGRRAPAPVVPPA
ncbi:MAG TPA: hypothetical protein VIK95_06975 [Egibacteraceae bacterium]